MNLESPRKGEGVALNAIEEQSLSSKSDDDEKMSKGKFTRFAKKIQEVYEIKKIQEKKLNNAKKIEKINGKREKYGERHGKRASN